MELSDHEEALLGCRSLDVQTHDVLVGDGDDDDEEAQRQCE